MVESRTLFCKIIASIWSGLKKITKEPAFYIYLISAVIYLPWFLPNLRDIGPYDETYYLISGRNLLQGQLPDLAGGPLLSFFYLLTYLPFINSPFWLIHANSLGRFILFSVVFLGAYHVAKSLKDHFQPVILYGFLFLTPLLTYNFEYPADLLFAGLSALAFAQAVNYLNTRSIKHLWWASFWLGLGMLTRGDALIIVLALAAFILIIQNKHISKWRLLMAVLIPFLTLSTGYVLMRGMITSDYQTGMNYRSYTAFEQGQEMDLHEDVGRFAAPTESYYVVRELFGTPEENQYSVFRAISRNPQAYLRRLINVTRSLPGLFLTAYYRRYAIFLGMLALRGLIELIGRKKYELVAVHLIWVLPLSAGIARTLVRVGYFRLFYFVVFSLAIIGVKALMDSLGRSYEGLVWAGLMGLVMLLALSQGDTAIQFGMLIFLCWLLLAYLLSIRNPTYPHWQQLALLLLFAGGLTLRGVFLIYQPRVLGEEPFEQASLVLREVTEPGDYVLTCTPSVVFMADRQVANFCSPNIPDFESSDAFIEWMVVQDFYAIFLDNSSPTYFGDLSFDQVGESLTQVYASRGGEAYIFMVNQQE